MHQDTHGEAAASPNKEQYKFSTNTTKLNDATQTGSDDTDRGYSTTFGLLLFVPPSPFDSPVLQSSHTTNVLSSPFPPTPTAQGTTSSRCCQLGRLRRCQHARHNKGQPGLDLPEPPPAASSFVTARGFRTGGGGGVSSCLTPA